MSTFIIGLKHPIKPIVPWVYNNMTVSARWGVTMDYMEGFVAAVSTKNKAAYIKHAKEAAELFKNRVLNVWLNVGETMCQMEN